MTNAVIQAVKEAADQLEHGIPYDWDDPCKDNVGLIARNLLQISESEVNKWFPAGYGYNWEDVYSQRLENAGLTEDIIESFEYLSDPIVIEEVGKELNYKNKEDVISYFRAFVKLFGD